MDHARAIGVRPDASPRAEAFLTYGAVAGPLFILVSVVHGVLRAGFDFAEHPLSLLTLGGLGWVQIVTFQIVGGLFAASALGMRRVLQGRPGGTWGPRCIGLFGIGLVLGGVFVPDAAFGFPPGSVLGAPDELSWHGAVHALAFTVGFGALVAGLFVLGRRHQKLGDRTRARVSVVIGIVVFLLSMWPNVGGDPEGRFAPLWAAMILGFGCLSLELHRLRTSVSSPLG